MLEPTPGPIVVLDASGAWQPFGELDAEEVAFLDRDHALARNGASAFWTGDAGTLSGWVTDGATKRNVTCTVLAARPSAPIP